MSQYLPYSGAHSIQEAVVAVHFRDRVSPEEVRHARDTAKVELEATLPRLNEHHQVQEIKIEQGQVHPISGEPRLVGFELSKVQADAKPARVLRLFENMLTVNFLQYTDWATTLRDSLEYTKLLLQAVKLTTNPVQAFSLRYIDRYTYDGSPNEPNAELLLRKGTDYLAPSCFGAGPLWHCHSGWFETLGSADKVLNQLNIGSTIVDQVSTVTIDHNAICQLNVPRQSVEALFEPPSGTAVGIEYVLDRLHDKNGDILKNILVLEMLERIGLKT